MLKYEGQCPTRLALKEALDEYFHKEVWYKQYLEGCQQVAAVEVNKPAAERAAIPSIADDNEAPAAATTAGPDPAGEHGANATATTRDQGKDGGKEEAETEANTTGVVVTPSVRSKRGRDEADGPTVSPSQCTRAQKRLVKEEDHDSVVADPPADGEAAIYPVVTRDDGELEDPHHDAAEVTIQQATARPTKEELENKRNQLITLLSQSHTSPSLRERIQTKIDEIDEALLEIIMS